MASADARASVDTPDAAPAGGSLGGAEPAAAPRQPEMPDPEGPTQSDPEAPISSSPDPAPPAADVPALQHDFELSTEGWRSVDNQRPEDTLDGTEQTTDLAHHGTGALRMVFDGEYTPVGGVTAEQGSFYGARLDVPPPPNTAVSLWMLSSAEGVSIEVYVLPDPTARALTLATVPLPEDEWIEISVVMPSRPARQLVVQVHSELDLDGFIYLDEIRW